MTKENMLFESADLWIYMEGKSEILKERILLAYHNKTNKIEAIGKEAEVYTLNPQPDIIVCSPIVQGIIDDYVIFEAFLKSMIKRAVGKGKLFSKPKIELCIPNDIYLNEVNKKAYTDAVYQAGAKKVTLTRQPFEEACHNSRSNSDIVLGIIMENKKVYLQEKLQMAKAYADLNKIKKEEVFQIIEQIYET